MRVVCGHRGVLTSPGPAGAADCGYGFADIIVLPLLNGKSWQLTSCVKIHFSAEVKLFFS